MVRAKTDPLIRQLENSLVVDAVAVDAMPPPETIKLSPVPGVSLAIPKGWIACDAATNALLGYAADPMDSKARVCGEALPDRTALLRVYNPRPLRTTVVSVFFDPGIRFTTDMLRSFGDSITPQVKAKFCSAVTAPMLQEQVTVESCEVAISSIAGRSAIATDVIGVPPGGALGRFHLRMFDVSNDAGYLQLQFNTPVAVESATRPDVDAIIASLEIAGTEAAPADGQKQSPHAPPPGLGRPMPGPP